MMKAVKLLAISFVAISASTVMAESETWYNPDNWYVGIGAGQSHYSDWVSKSGITDFKDEFGSSIGVDDFAGSQSASTDDSDFGYKLFAGYSFHKYLAAELSYINMGKADAKSSASGTFYDVMDNAIDGDLSAKASAKVDAFTLDLSMNYPIASFAAVIVNGGVYAADTKLKLDASSSISAENYSTSKTYSSTGLHYGAGINFKVTDVIGIRTEWERLNQVKANGGKDNVDLLSAALIYNF